MPTTGFGPLFAGGLSFVGNFRQSVNSLSEVQVSGAGQIPATLAPSFTQDDSDALRVRRRPRAHSTSKSTSLIASAYTTDTLCDSGITDVTPPVCVGATADATLLSNTKSKFTVTIQPLPTLRPSPPRFLRWMLEHSGGGRFRPIDIGRPGPERLAVQYVEGRDITDNNETGEPWSPHPTTGRLPAATMCEFHRPAEAAIVDELGPNTVSKRPRIKYAFDVDFAPEQLAKFERRVAKRIRQGHLDRLHPLKQAVHNCLARVVDLKAGTKEKGEIGKPKRSRNHSRTSSFKLDLEDDQRPRRTRPTVQPLDMEAARAHVPTTDSPPESPAPTTPVDGSSLDSIYIVGEEGAVFEELVQEASIERKSPKGGL